MTTRVPGVFACGEVVTGPGSCIASIASGHEAATSIHRFLRGEDLAADRVYRPVRSYARYQKADRRRGELAPSRRDARGRGKERAKDFRQVELGFTRVEQQPVGRTPRANLLTYTRALDPLRKMFAATPKRLQEVFRPGTFRLTSPGGRCETCNGEGFERVEMQFLADVFVRCAQCGGKRFKEEVLDIKLRGISIGDMLEMSAREILDRFPENRQLAEALRTVIAMGLEYIRLGQPLSTLSGGEAQRLKLIRYLSGGQPGGEKLFILDEPTPGLHPEDISKLIRVLGKLVERGNTVWF